MTELYGMCQALLQDTPQALAVAVVDLETGLPLAAVHNVPYFTQSYVDLVSALAADVFRGKNIQNLEKALSSHRGKPVTRAVEEVQMATPGTLHFMAVLPERGDTLVVLVTPRGADVAASWGALRAAMPLIGKACPGGGTK